MFKKMLSNFFNSSSNTAAIPDKGVVGTPEEKLAAWLSHPLEYGKKPIYTKIIDTGKFSFRFLPGSPQMNYFLVEYKMGEDQKIEIAIVDEVSVWSFMNVIDYEKIDRKKLKTAYLGKLCEIMQTRMNMIAKIKRTTDSPEERERILNIFISKSPNLKDSVRIVSINKFNDDITFFLAEISEGNNSKTYLPGLANATEYDVEEIFVESDPMVSLGVYYEMGKLLVENHPA